MPAPRSGKRWGLILFVLLIDIGLAVAGGLMLNESLSDPPARAASRNTSTSTQVPKGETAVAERAVPATPSAGSATGAAEPTATTAIAAPSHVAATLVPVIEHKAGPNKEPAKQRVTRGVKPLDPYGDPLPPEQK